MKVWVVGANQHDNDGDYGLTEVIGVFSSEDLAFACVRRPGLAKKNAGIQLFEVDAIPENLR